MTTMIRNDNDDHHDHDDHDKYDEDDENEEQEEDVHEGACAMTGYVRCRQES